MTKDVWRLEQQVTGGELGDPEEFVNELFQARHGLLAVRTMAALSAAIYGRMATLQRVSPDGCVLVADVADQFDQVRSVADGEKDYLQGVIDFYQNRSDAAGNAGDAGPERGGGAADAGKLRTKRGDQEDLCLGGDPVCSDLGRHHLRDEL